jgi:hypothetical protein
MFSEFHVSGLLVPRSLCDFDLNGFAVGLLLPEHKINDPSIWKFPRKSKKINPILVDILNLTIFDPTTNTAFKVWYLR